MKKDKIYHLIVGLIISVVTGYLIIKLTGLEYLFFSGFFAALIAGIAKEYVWDKWMKQGTFEIADIAFTTLGGAIGLTIISLL